MRRPTLFAALALPLLLAACYTYAPIEPVAALPGTGVRARVSAVAADRLTPLLGSTDTRLLVGTLIRNDAGEMIVEVPSAVRMDVGGAVETLHQRVTIRRGELLELESRRLDRTRTALLVGAGAVGIGGIILGIHGEPGMAEGPRGGGTEIRLPVIRLRF